MSRKQVKETLYNVLTDHWCPKQLAEDASAILSHHYPNTVLIGATEEEIRTVKQAQEYVKGGDA